MKELYLEQRIIRYLSDQMEPAERAEFEHQLKADLKLQDEYKAYAGIWKDSLTVEPPSPPDTQDAWSRFERSAFDEVPVVPMVSRWQQIARIAAVLLVIASSAFAWFKLAGPTQDSMQPTIVAASDQRIKIDLPDGSQVWLNKGSELSYDPTFTSRIVHLTGEGFFEVTHQENVPFEVHTSTTTTTVLGTAFNVDATDQDQVSVYVESGRVSFVSKETSTAARTLSKGDKGTFDQATQEITLTVEDINEISWKTDQLKFVDTPVKELLDVLEDHFGIECSVSNEALWNCTYNATFEGATLLEVLDDLSFGLDVDTEIDGTHVQLNGGGCPPMQ